MHILSLIVLKQLEGPPHYLLYAKTSFLDTKHDRYYPGEPYIFAILKTVTSQKLIYYFIPL